MRSLRKEMRSQRPALAVEEERPDRSGEWNAISGAGCDVSVAGCATSPIQAGYPMDLFFVAADVRRLHPFGHREIRAS
jgi:hypothetical protein